MPIVFSCLISFVPVFVEDEMELEPKNPQRLLYPVPEARQLLGGIGHSTFYAWVKADKIRLTKIGGRSFVSGPELKRVAGVA